MTTIVRFTDVAGTSLLVEMEDDRLGARRISRADDAIVDAAQRLENVLATIRPALETLTGTLRELAPTSHSVEFGVKLNAEAGAVVAKTAVEGHFIVRLNWGTVGE